MRACILNSDTNKVENIIQLETLDPANFVPYKNNITLSSRHDGEIGWELVDNNWIKPSDSSPVDTDEMSRVNRKQRDSLLLETDRYLLEDYPITAESKELIKVYRQQLRDLPSSIDWPANIIWPVKPTLF